MRDLRFRAWFPQAKRMLSFENVVIDDEYDRLAIELVDSDAVQRYGHLAGESYLPNESFKLMQYTGLKDKKGKEIFQGDILGGSWGDGWIDWCDKCKSNEYFMSDFGCAQCSGDVSWGEVVDSNNLEVIGNIYSNPELLEKS